MFRILPAIGCSVVVVRIAVFVVVHAAEELIVVPVVSVVIFGCCEVIVV